MRSIVSRRELFRFLGAGVALAGLGASRSFAASDTESLDKGSASSRARSPALQQ